MSATTHPVAPEEVMAFLDGGLSETDAQTVSRHLEHCAECTAIAQKFRGTSQLLSLWSVPAAPKTMEDSVKGSTDKSVSAEKIGNPNIFIRAGFWTWKQWTGGITATAAALLLLVAAGIATLEQPKMRVATPRVEAGLKGMSVDNTTVNAGPHPQQTERESSLRGSAGKLQVEGQLTNHQQSQSLALRPRIAADSNTRIQSSIGFGSGAGRGPSQTSPSDLPVTGRAIDSFLPLQQPMIARTVSLSIVTKDFATARAALDAILVRRRGYAAELSANTAENTQRSLQAALRIPASELSSAVADLKTLGRVENESQSGEEVTQQHADLLARLKNSHETELRLQAILTQRTGKIKDVLEVEREIARVRGEIEAMEAEQTNVEHRVEFASVNLQLIEEYKASLNAPAASIATRIHNAMVAGFKNVSEAVLAVLLFFFETGPSILLAALIFLAPAWLLWRRYRRALVSA